MNILDMMQNAANKPKPATIGKVVPAPSSKKIVEIFSPTTPVQVDKPHTVNTVRFDTGELKKAILSASKYLPKNLKYNNPAYNGFWLKFVKDQLYIYATNLDSRIRIPVNGVGSLPKDGIVIPGKELKSWVDECGKTTIELQLIEEHKILLKGSTSRSMDLNFAEEYAMGMITDYELQESRNTMIPVATWDAKELVRAIRAVEQAVSKDETRPVLTCILFERLNGLDYFNLAAGDSFRLHTSKLNTKWLNESVDHGHLLPGVEVIRLADTIEAVKAKEVKLFEFNDHLRVFKIGEVVVILPPEEGNFPRYENVIPQVKNFTVKLDCEELISLVEEGIKAHNCGKHDLAFAVWDFEEGKIKAFKPGTWKNEDRFFWECAVEVDRLTIEPECKIFKYFGLNLKYFKAALESAQSKAVEISFLGSSSPMVIKNDLVTFTIMPVTLGNC